MTSNTSAIAVGDSISMLGGDLAKGPTQAHSLVGLLVATSCHAVSAQCRSGAFDGLDHLHQHGIENGGVSHGSVQLGYAIPPEQTYIHEP